MNHTISSMGIPRDSAHGENALANKLAVIMAAGSGMGAAGVRRFVQEGARVAAIDVNPAGIDALVSEFGPDKVVAIQADLSTPKGAQGSIDQAAETLGGIDILWAHVGIPGPPGFGELDLAEYHRTMDLNVTANAIASYRAVPMMRQRGGGAIVFTSSMVGLVGAGASPIYGTAKWGVVGLAKSLAVALGGDKIRVNAVCPGLTDTPMKRDFVAPGGTDAEDEANTQRLVSMTPLGRLGQPDDIANAALWLASDEASFVTGVALAVDGGYTAR
jgi:NAD(P)-dependent dehydrogenase (short-subunit alcohol dehydrogenase family)